MVLTPNHSPESSAYSSRGPSRRRVGNEKGSIDRSSCLFASNSDSPVPNFGSSLYPECGICGSSCRPLIIAFFGNSPRRLPECCSVLCVAFWNHAVVPKDTGFEDSIMTLRPDLFVQTNSAHPLAPSLLEKASHTRLFVAKTTTNLSSKPHSDSHHFQSATVEAPCVPANLICFAVTAPAIQFQANRAENRTHTLVSVDACDSRHPPRMHRSEGAGSRRRHLDTCRIGTYPLNPCDTEDKPTPKCAGWQERFLG